MRTKQLILLIMGIFILTGCGSQKQTVNKYYVIEKPDSLETTSVQQKSVIDDYCEIVPVEVYPAYASQSIANRSSSHEIIYYETHNWAVRPGESFTLLLEDYLSEASVFKGAATRFWKVSPGFRWVTTIYQLEVLEDNKNLVAHLALKFSLYNYESRDLLLSHKANRKKILPEKDLNLFAEIIAEMFYEELNKFSREIMKQIPEMKQSL
jgi:uncharacterized lipoprotein YmbA